MAAKLVEVRVEGKTFRVPSAEIQGRTVTVRGKWLKVATVQDEEFVSGEPVADPQSFISALRGERLGADVFTFAQPLNDLTPKHDYPLEWDNAAVIPITTYEAWLNSLSQDTRRNVKKAAKQGVNLRIADFNDTLVRGIVEIYNETPVRQGRRFWHYGKSFELVKEETATYLDRSDFIGAYFGEELIGFIKMAYVNGGAHIIHILSKVAHADKRPTNALIAKAVEVCAGKGVSRFVYCKYVYGKNDTSPLTEFKRRNGFEQVQYPRYYVPLSLKGKVALGINLHHGWRNLLPRRLFVALLATRRRFFEMIEGKPSVATREA
jgi:hypothetical protein